jgi:hypothetical protein
MQAVMPHHLLHEHSCKNRTQNCFVVAVNLPDASSAMLPRRSLRVHVITAPRFSAKRREQRQALGQLDRHASYCMPDAILSMPAFYSVVCCYESNTRRACKILGPSEFHLQAIAARRRRTGTHAPFLLHMTTPRETNGRRLDAKRPRVVAMPRAASFRCATFVVSLFRHWPMQAQ